MKTHDLELRQADMMRRMKYIASRPVRSLAEVAAIIVPTNASITLNARAIEDLSGPMVYLFRGGGLILYVGASKHGLNRVLSPAHHAKQARKEATSVLLYFCASYRDALDLEHKLIKQYSPKYNSILFGGQRSTQWQRDRGMS